MSDKTPEQRIDDALDTVLKASGSSLKHYTLPSTLEAMRGAMRKVMTDSYIAGSNACHRAYANKEGRCQLRAAIRRLCNMYVVDDYYIGQLREEHLEAAVNRAINAAMEENQP